MLHPRETTLYPGNELEEPLCRDNELTGVTAPPISQATSFIPNSEAPTTMHGTGDDSLSPSSSTRPPSRRPLPHSYSPITAPETGFTAAPAVPLSASNVDSNYLGSAHQNARPFLLPGPSHSDSLPAAHLRHQLEALPSQFSPHVPGSLALACFIQALHTQGIHDNPEFVERGSAVYDQVFRHSFSPTCPCSTLVEANESEHAQTLQEVAQHLQNFLPPLSAAFGDSVSYNTNDYFHQWRSFLSDQPTRPLSFQKSQVPLLRSGVSISRHWDIDSIWIGATGLQVIRPPTDFRLSFLPYPTRNLSTDQVIRPHGLQLAKTRHILLGTFNARCVRFSVFLFFLHAAPSLSTSTIKSALSFKRQKDLYDRIIIPAACETIPGPALQEMPQTYEIAYAKSRSFQEKPGNKRWRAEDESRSLHLQYAIPTQYLMPFWRSILKYADSFQILNRSRESVPYFKDPRLLFQSHDLKNTFGRETLQETLSLFQETVLQVLDPVHLDIRSCWLDIGFRDHVACPGPQASSSEPFTLLWKSRCHHHLHEKLSQVNPSTSFEADYFQGFLLRDIADYQSKATSSGASNPGRREQGDPGIIRFKACNCIKEQVSVMFNSYNIFGSGFLPLLALNEDMMKSLSSTSEGGRSGCPCNQDESQLLIESLESQ